MEAAEKTGRRITLRRWKERVRELIPDLVEKALRSDTLQGVLLKQLEKQMLLRLRTSADPRRPRQVPGIKGIWLWRIRIISGPCLPMTANFPEFSTRSGNRSTWRPIRKEIYLSRRERFHPPRMPGNPVSRIEELEEESD